MFFFYSLMTLLLYGQKSKTIEGGAA